MSRETPDWLSYEDALAEVLSACTPCGIETASLPDALGRAAAEEIRSRVPHPPWDNSAMDGFAVRAEDVASASPERPVRLPVSDDVPAGTFPSGPLAPGTAARVMTGAPVPEGATGVVRVEHTDLWESDDPAARGERSPEQVSIYRNDDAERNVRRAGEDLERDELLIRPGEALSPAAIGVLALTGVQRLRVGRRPRVGVLANGDELADFDELDEVLAGRKIMNSNSHALAAQLRSEGAVPVELGIARDDPDALRSHLRLGASSDAIITAAGVSVGEHDHVKAVLDELGFERSFWRVKVRPGSALLFGRLDGKPFWGVPGNPVSAMVAFEAFIRPAVRKMSGHRRLRRRRLAATVAEPIAVPSGYTYFVRVRLEPGSDGVPRARLTGPQGSGILTSMLAADGLLVVPEGLGGYEVGDRAKALLLSEWDEAEA